MAPTSPSTAYLTAGGAVGVAVLAALFTPAGPWQAVSAGLGWAVPLLVGLGLVSGRSGPVLVGVALHVVRAGVHGIAGDRSPGLAIWALMVVAMVELASASWEARRLPLPLDSVVARTVLLAASAGLVTGLLAVGQPAVLAAGALPAVLGLSGAMALALILLRAGRRT